MKNCDEMVNSLLERRNRYATEQKRKKTIITRTVTSMCCVCLVSLLGFSMWQGGMLDTKVPGQTLDDALYPGVKDTFDESKGESADNSISNNRIVINSVGESVPADAGIGLLPDDFVEMTRDEMVAYYGVDYIPTVPEDIKAWEEDQIGIYRRNGGTGEVYWDADILNYSNEDFTRNIYLAVDKGSNVFTDLCYFNGTEEKSVINNIEVLIGLSENGYYYAEFMYEGVGFHLNAEGVTEDEFISLVTSLVD